MINERARKLGDALVAARVLTPEQLRSAIGAASRDGATSLIVSLLQDGFLTFKVFEKFIASTLSVQSAIISSRPPVKQVLDIVGKELLSSRLIYPFGLRSDKGVRTIALGMVDPLDSEAIRLVETKTGCRVVPVLISLADFKEAMAKFFQPMVEVPPQNEEFVLVRPGGHEEEVKSQQTSSLIAARAGGNTGSVTFQGTKTVQPKPGWEHGPTQTNIDRARLSVDLMGSNKRKFREEILAKLDLDPSDAKFLQEENYTRELLFNHLKNASPNRLQKIYNKMPDGIKIEGLVNTLIKSGVISKSDLLAWTAVSLAFQEEPK